jgi:hypothetical protein
VPISGAAGHNDAHISASRQATQSTANSMPLSVGKHQFSSTTCGRNGAQRFNASSPFEVALDGKAVPFEVRPRYFSESGRHSTSNAHVLKCGGRILVIPGTDTVK